MKGGESMWIVNQDGFFSWTLGDPEKYKKLYMPNDYVVVRARDEVSLIRMRDRICASAAYNLKGNIWDADQMEVPFNIDIFGDFTGEDPIGKQAHGYDRIHLTDKALQKGFKSLQIEGPWDGDYKYRMGFPKGWLREYFNHYVDHVEYTSFKGAMHDLWTEHYVQPMASWKLDSLLDIWAAIKNTWVSTRVEDWRKLDIQ